MSIKFNSWEGRFWDKVYPEPNSGCWIWGSAHCSKKQYGFFWLDGRNAYAHRLSWELFNGAIPDGMLVCHKCDKLSAGETGYSIAKSLGIHKKRISDIKNGRKYKWAV